MAVFENAFGLAECLTQLREELSAVAADGEGSDLKFAIQEVDLEFTLVASNKDTGDAGVKWYILSAGVGTEVGEVATQKLSMKLHVTDPSGERSQVKGRDAQK